MDERAYLSEKLKKYFVYYPDFPKSGVNFWDIFAIFKNQDAFYVLYNLLKCYANSLYGKVDVVAGIEARGFLLGPLIASELGISFIPLRKKGKLPGTVESLEYTLEYGTDIIEIQKDALKPGQKVLIVDDVIATGGTMAAAVQLIKKLNAEVVECMAIVTIPELCKTDAIDAKITILCDQ